MPAAAISFAAATSSSLENGTWVGSLELFVRDEDGAGTEQDEGTLANQAVVGDRGAFERRASERVGDLVERDGQRLALTRVDLEVGQVRVARREVGLVEDFLVGLQLADVQASAELARELGKDRRDAGDVVLSRLDRRLHVVEVEATAGQRTADALPLRAQRNELTLQLVELLAQRQLLVLDVLNEETVLLVDRLELSAESVLALEGDLGREFGLRRLLGRGLRFLRRGRQSRDRGEEERREDPVLHDSYRLSRSSRGGRRTGQAPCCRRRRWRVECRAPTRWRASRPSLRETEFRLRRSRPSP